MNSKCLFNIQCFKNNIHNHSLGGFGFLDKQLKNSQLNKENYLAGI